MSESSLSDGREEILCGPEMPDTVASVEIEHDRSSFTLLQRSQITIAHRKLVPLKDSEPEIRYEICSY